jgi:hypothetical protein
MYSKSETKPTCEFGVAVVSRESGTTTADIKTKSSHYLWSVPLPQYRNMTCESQFVPKSRHLRCHDANRYVTQRCVTLVGIYAREASIKRDCMQVL